MRRLRRFASGLDARNESDSTLRGSSFQEEKVLSFDQFKERNGLVSRLQGFSSHGDRLQSGSGLENSQQVPLGNLASISTALDHAHRKHIEKSHGDIKALNSPALSGFQEAKDSELKLPFAGKDQHALNLPENYDPKTLRKNGSAKSASWLGNSSESCLSRHDLAGVDLSDFGTNSTVSPQNLTQALQKMSVLRNDDRSFFNDQMECVLLEMARLAAENSKLEKKLSHYRLASGGSTKRSAPNANSGHLAGSFALQVVYHSSNFAIKDSISVSATSTSLSIDTEKRNSGSFDDSKRASEVWIVCQNSLVVAYTTNSEELVEEFMPLDSNVILSLDSDFFILDHTKLGIVWRVSSPSFGSANGISEMFECIQRRIRNCSKEEEGRRIVVSAECILSNMNSIERGRDKLKRIMHKMKREAVSKRSMQQYCTLLESRLVKTMNSARTVAAVSALELAHRDRSTNIPLSEQEFDESDKEGDKEVSNSLAARFKQLRLDLVAEQDEKQQMKSYVDYLLRYISKRST